MVEGSAAAVGALALQDRPDGLVGTLIQLGVLAVVFGGPILKGILDERQKKGDRGASARPSPASPPSPPKQARAQGGGAGADLERDGKDLWKQLLEGVDSYESSTAAQEAPPAAKPTAPKRRPEDPFVEPTRDPRSEARKLSEERVRRRPARKRLASALPSGPIPSEGEIEAGAHGEARLERAGGDVVRPHVPLTNLSSFEGGLPLGGDGALGGALGSLGDVVGTDPLASKPPRPRVALDRESLRRAVLMSEVLGPPVALRRPGLLDPPGLG